MILKLATEPVYRLKMGGLLESFLYDQPYALRTLGQSNSAYHSFPERTIAWLAFISEKRLGVAI